MTYTLADLARITGAKPRSAQLWAEAGVVKADFNTERGGSGVHRRFSRHEAMVACVVSTFAAQQVAIGKLIKIGEVVRRILHSPSNAERFENAIDARSAGLFLYFKASNPTILTILCDENDIPELLKILPRRVTENNLLNIVHINGCLAGLR